jgi:hypothetical protein
MPDEAMRVKFVYVSRFFCGVHAEKRVKVLLALKKQPISSGKRACWVCARESERGSCISPSSYIHPLTLALGERRVLFLPPPLGYIMLELALTKLAY